MKLFENIQRLQQLDQLIRLKATGSPDILAKKINVSKRTLYYLLDTLRDHGGKIYYNKTIRTYYYSLDTPMKIEFSLGIDQKHA